MPSFGKTSLERLGTCHSDLQTLFNEVIKTFDCIVLEGHRGQEAQDKAFREGKSQKQWPSGKHNQLPSLAIDVAPYSPPVTVDWNDIKRFYYFAGFVKGTARQLKSEGKITHDIRFGGDWDNDTEVKDNSFNDLVHFELI